MRSKMIALGSVAATVLAMSFVSGPPSAAQSSIPRELAAGRLRPAVLHVNGTTKRLPAISGGLMAAAQESLGTTSVDRSAFSAGVNGAQVDSLGCSGRSQGRNVRVNQDCTYRRQAEEHIAYNPTDPRNLVAGMNDSIIGWNKTSLDFSLDGGRHWGAISTAPFSYRLNAPDQLLPTSGDPNRHTILGGEGTLHSYDACSDPYLTFDSRGRAFYTCVAFDIATNASLVFAVPSPVGAKASYFDQVYPPFGLVEGVTGREHIIAEDNNPGAFADGPKIRADAYVGSPNRDNVYETWTNFDQTCPVESFGYCESPTYASMSTDHGFTWSTPEKISGRSRTLCGLGDTFNPDLNPHSCNFNGHSDLQVLPDGDVAVTFQNGNTPTADQQFLAVHCSPGGSSTAGTAHMNCDEPHKVADQITEGAPRCDFGRGPEQCIPGAFIRAPIETSQRLAVNQNNGDLFDTWFDYRSDEFDIWLSRSVDGGVTWSAPRRVNPDTGTDHYFSSIDVGEAGAASHNGVAYYRTRRIPNENDTPPGGFVPGDPGVAERSSDFVLSGGFGLATPYAFTILSPRFPPPDGIQAGFNGDYSGLVVIGTSEAHAIWSDTRVRIPDPSFDHGTVDEDVFTDRKPLPG
jgi:hypothetical protein